MLFTVHHKDTGEIQASTKVYSPEDCANFAKRLAEMGHAFVSAEGTTPHNHFEKYVRGGQLAQRPTLSVTLSKSVIKANDKDAAELTGLPKPCRVVVSAAGMTLMDQTVTDGGISITSQVPTTYTIAVYAFPFKMASFQVEARA